MPARIGSANPNWKGGLRKKVCSQCLSEFMVKPARDASARFCSLRCANAFMAINPLNKGSRGGSVIIKCLECAAPVKVFRAHARRVKTCGSDRCKSSHRSRLVGGSKNGNWHGGLSMRPYPWRFQEARRLVVERDQAECQNESCYGKDKRITVHHIDYDKANCSPENLITLCSSCNSRANFGRDEWMKYYRSLIAVKKVKGNWEEEF